MILQDNCHVGNLCTGLTVHAIGRDLLKITKKTIFIIKYLY